MKTIFKVGDKVFHFAYGWGTIKDFVRDSIRVDFYDVSNGIRLFDGNSIKLISLAEYTLAGFSQERPEELPKKGQIVWVRGVFPSEWQIGHFFEKKYNEYRVTVNASISGWTHYGIEITTTNPYEDEQH